MSNFDKPGAIGTILIDGLPGEPDPLLSTEERLAIAREGLSERYGVPLEIVGVIELGPEQMTVIAPALLRWEEEIRDAALRAWKPDDKAMHETMTAALITILGASVLEGMERVPMANGIRAGQALIAGMRAAVAAVRESEGGAA